MSTVRDIIKDALYECGAQAVGDALRSEDAAFAMRTLNRLLSSWNADYGMIYSMNRIEFSLIGGQQKYTIGTGGDFNMDRPARIDMASILIGGTTPEVGCKILSDEEWRNIAVKSTTSTIPTMVWFSGNVPYQEAYLWPIPADSTCKIVLYCWGKTSAYTDLNDTVAFPDGYEEAIVTNLAMHLCSSWGINPSPVLVERASKSKSVLLSLNSEPPRMYCDGAILGSGITTNAIKTFGIVVD